jgi:hypothetical protein
MPILVRGYLFTHCTTEILLNPVFEDLRTPKVPNTRHVNRKRHHHPTPSRLGSRRTRPASHLASSTRWTMIAPHKLCDDGGSQVSYGSKATSARTRPLLQLSLRQAPLLLRQPRHHASKVPRPLRLPHWHVLRALALSPLDT